MRIIIMKARTKACITNKSLTDNVSVIVRSDSEYPLLKIEAMLYRHKGKSVYVLADIDSSGNVQEFSRFDTLAELKKELPTPKHYIWSSNQDR